MVNRSFVPPTLCFALLTGDDEELVRHQIAAIRYFEPTAKIVLYENRMQKSTDLGMDVQICPSSDALPAAQSGSFLLDVMSWLAETNAPYDYLVALNQKTMLIKPKFGRWLEQTMQGYDMMGINLCRYRTPESSEHWLPGQQMWKEWSIWQPLFQMEGFFGALSSMQVFRHELVEQMIAGRSAPELKRAWQTSNGYFMEEIVYPTLAQRFGGRLRTYPSESVSFVRFDQKWGTDDVRLAKGDPHVFFMYPFAENTLDAARQLVYRTEPRTPESLFAVGADLPKNSFENEIWKRICEQAPPDYTIPDPSIVKYIMPYKSIDPPTDFCRTVETWLETQQGSNREEEIFYREYYPEERIVFQQSPKSLANQQPMLPASAFARNNVNARGAIAVIPEGRVWGMHGSVITPDNKLLYDVSREWVSSPKEHTLFFQQRLPFPHEFNGTVATLASVSGDNYYHWIHDVLSRLIFLQQSGLAVDKYVVNRLQHPFQHDTLRLLGIPEEKIIECHWDLHLKAKHLVVVSFPHRSKWGSELLRNEWIKRLNLDSVHRRKQRTRLYISRANSAHRNVLNERKVVDILQTYGFQSVELEDYTVEQQMELFASAEAIVSPHGAGLANLVFCKSGTKLVEMFSPHFVRDGYWLLSNYNSLEYYVLLAKKGERPAQYVNSAWYYNGFDNIEIDEQSLIEILAQAGIRK